MSSLVSSDWQDSCSTIQDANSKLLSSKKFSDVVFLVGEERVQIHAHKFILMSRSSVFETMFERWETEKNCQVEIPEITHSSFQLFLRYLYCNTFSVTGNNAAEVLYLAHKYSTKELVKLCSDLLKSAIQVSNVVHIHQVATRLDQTELRAQAMEFILRNGKAVFEDAGFIEFDFEALATLLRDDKLAMDELTVFRAAIRWAENKCFVHKLNCTGENKRDVLKDIIHLIRFPIMRSQDFTDEVVGKNKGILTDSETIGIYMHFSANGVTNTTLPAHPFNDNKRGPTEIYQVQVYGATNNFIYKKISCRQVNGDWSDYQCESTLIFKSSQNICVSAIDIMHESIILESGQERDISISISVSTIPAQVDSLPTRHQSASVAQTQLHIKKSSTMSSTRIEFDRGIDIFKNTEYAIKISCADGGRGGVPPVLRRGQPTIPSKSLKVPLGSKNVTLAFVSEESQCGSQYGVGSHNNGYDTARSGSQNCICLGLIKTIHFTI